MNPACRPPPRHRAVAGRYRALHQIVADVPDPIGDAYLRISKSWRSLSRQDKQLALINLEWLEAQADELGGAGKSVALLCHLSQYLAHFGLTIWRSLIELSGVVDRLPPCCRSSRACKAAERTLPEPRLRQRARPDCAT